MSELNGLEGRFGIVFSPDGRILVTCSGDRAVRLWDTATSQLLHVLTLPQVPNCRRVAPNVAFSSDGRELAVVSGANVMFFDVASGALRGSLDGYSFTATLAFSRDSSALIVVNGYEVLTLDARSGELLQTRLSDEPVKSIAMAFSPDGRLLLGHEHDPFGETGIWDMMTGKLLWRVELMSAGVFSPDGRLLATVSRDGVVRLWGLEIGD